MFCYICERKRPELLGRLHRNSTGTGQRRSLCYPFSIQISVMSFSSSFLQSTCRCYSREAAQESVCAELGEADVDVGGKSPLQNSGGLGEREASNCSKHWAGSRADKERELFFSLTPSHHPKATSLYQTQLEVLPMILCCFSYQLLQHHFFLTFSFLIQSLA